MPDEISQSYLAETLYEDIKGVLLKLTPEQTRYVFERIVSKRASVSYDAILRWKRTIPEIELALRLLFIKPLEASLNKLEQSAVTAAAALIDLLDSDSENMRLKAANSIFKHLGSGASKYLKVDVTHTQAIPDDELISRAFGVLERSGNKLPSGIIDGEIVN
jgi:hypothetical protein